MLVLSRKVKEQVRIGDNITLTVLQVKGKTIRVGIEAPREIRVVRGELPRKESSPANAREKAGAQETEEVQSHAAAGRLQLPQQPAGPASRLRDLVLKVTAHSATTTSAV